jgi:hypothetical protein
LVTVLFLAVAAVCFTFALWQSRRPHRPTRTPVVIEMTALGVAFTVLSPAAQQLESQLWPSLGRLLSNVATLLAAFAVSLLVKAIATGEGPKLPSPRLIPLVVAIAILVVTFFLSDTPGGLGIFTGLYRSQPTLVVYSLVYSGYLGVVLLDVGFLAGRTILPARGALRWALATMTLGSALGLAYVAAKVYGVLDEAVTGRVAEEYCPGPFSTAGCTFSVAMPALSVLAIVAGMVIPAAAARIRDLVAYRQVRPLWQTLVGEVPEIAFAAEVSGEESGLRFRLYRRVIEINDGILVLRTSLAQDERDPGDDPAELARALRLALQRRRRDDPPATGSANRTPAERVNHPPVDLDAEIRWLRGVSKAFTSR